MVLRRPASTRALIVPDEETWLVFGGDGADDIAPAEPGRAHVLLLPERVPEGLVAGVHSAWEAMPTARSVRVYESPLPGVAAGDVLAAGEAEHEGQGGGHEHEGHGGADEHGGHDHGDMMAITGEPSADGLVMERLELQAGPLGVALWGGLVIQGALDGDVVAACDVRATLSVGDDSRPPDPWSAVAWAAAELAAREELSAVAARADRWFRLAALEAERAVAHVAWLHSFCRLLGWADMTARVRALLARLLRARSALPVEVTTPDLPDATAGRAGDELREAAVVATDLASALEKSKRFARRTAGLGQLDRDAVIARGLVGPVARASGLAADARADDPGYRALGFEPTCREDGDARARAVVRAAEAARALELAAAAIGRARQADGDDGATPRFGRPAADVVESARGPVTVGISASGEPQRSAPGARAAQQAAGELAVGREWAAALVTIASFDVSPWRVGA